MDYPASVHPRSADAGISLDEALDATRTGDIWLFRGHSGPDRAIRTLTNSPVNHVAMTVGLDDLPPLLWHAELGDKLTDVWTGSNHRGVQLHDAREAVEQWMIRYEQSCWIRQLTPDVTAEQEDILLRVIARLDGTPFPTTARLAGRWLRGRIPTSVDMVRGIPYLDRKARERRARRHDEEHKETVGLEAAYCAEVVAITYSDMGLVDASKDSNWFDPGRFWSGDRLPLTTPFHLGDEVAVHL
ncbi:MULTISPECIES: guanylate cyclase [unclassified Gordonia (in: high G+C Gram-positive bacteria)]|uniref:guanylate cyclase n=1 Tax=unclassified Gordonia (in: high G+C Gram-positive bacteria) TaxID=2657482 RepID=UPI001F0DF7EC|nr:guanylate cyclase [Gordonia sp. ABSL49_1]MCH5643668.1 guanylate cyclase [Gordonia sp. ABSL49_1]